MANPQAVQGKSEENFAQLLEESLRNTKSFEGTVVKGTVLAVEGEYVLVDVGLKAEGRIALKEFAAPGRPAEVKVGDLIDVFVDRIEGRDGEASLSREKAKREESWIELERAYKASERVNGVMLCPQNPAHPFDPWGEIQ